MFASIAQRFGCCLVSVAVMCAVFACQTAPADNPNEQVADQLVEAVTDLWENQNLEALQVLHHPDYQRITPMLTTTGLDEHRADLTATFQTWSNIDLTIKNHWVVDDMVFLEWTWQGTNTGPLGENLPATGKRITTEGLSKVTLKDGKIWKDELYWDTQKGNATLGFTLLPPQLAAAKAETDN